MFLGTARCRQPASISNSMNPSSEMLRCPGKTATYESNRTAISAYFVLAHSRSTGSGRRALDKLTPASGKVSRFKAGDSLLEFLAGL